MCRVLAAATLCGVLALAGGARAGDKDKILDKDLPRDKVVKEKAPTGIGEDKGVDRDKGPVRDKTARDKDAVDRDKKTDGETIKTGGTVIVTASDFAREFERNVDEAMRKYWAPPGKTGGAKLNMSGRVREARDGRVFFETESPVQITLIVDKIHWPAAKAKRMTFEVKGARVVDFRRGGGGVMLEATDVRIANAPDEGAETKEKSPPREKLER